MAVRHFGPISVKKVSASHNIHLLRAVVHPTGSVHALGESSPVLDQP